MLFRSRPGRRSGTGLELEALEDRVLPQGTATIVVLSRGEPVRFSNLTPPGKGQVNWTAPDLRSAVVNAGQTGSETDTVVLPVGAIDLIHGALEVSSGLDLPDPHRRQQHVRLQHGPRRQRHPARRGL